ncbi:MAG: RecQ family ATP-dependent DNA helicase [Bacteroidales bacterium]|nr:RecQ family ATP-dependent DNA helicase [Bacteroidales bacterium]
MDIHQILLKYWGFISFRPMQEDIIRSVLNGNDTLALLPTGGGKSICFQVPAMTIEGLCIVVTPLIALMRDQVENLKKKGIDAVAIYSGMHPYEMEVAINNCIFNKKKFLYCSPERLETDLIRLNIERMGVNLVAVDEAHCISQWGYDFRPSYLKIAEIRQYLPDVPFLALTATATPKVVDDIQEKLNFKKKNFFQQSFERKNLTYVVQLEEDKLKRLLKVATNLKGSGIVYVRNRKKTVEISDFLNKNSIRSDFYHAGLDNRQRAIKQTAWMKGETRVMVSTNAFGMGIDKPNVRFVAHMDLTDSLEAYFQEAGRGGRDGKSAYAVLLFEKADIMDAEKFLESRFPDIQTIRNVYQSLGSINQLAIGSGKDVTIDFDLYAFCSQFNFNQTDVIHSLGFLEKEGYLLLQDVTNAESKIHFKTSKEDLYKFQVEHARFDKFIKVLLRSYSGLFTEFVKINESEIAKRSELKIEEVKKLLFALDKFDIISYLSGKSQPQIVYLTERLDAGNIRISAEHYLDRKKEAQIRLQSVIQYITNDSKCRSRQLLEYFGENDSRRCGRCDVCIERNKIELNELEFDTVVDQIKPFLLSSSLTVEEVTGLVRSVNEGKVIRVIQWLLDNEKVVYDEERKLRWKGK